jgi:NitT/TauT family transport system substrate-binding protein
MKRQFGLVLGLIGAAALTAFAAPAPAAAETVRIAHSTWVGYGPFYVARDKGFFKKHGVDVDLIVMEEPKERFPAMLAGRIDMIASTVDTALLYLKKPDDFRYVVAIDDSDGGDGIVATKSIKTLADLKGKNVAFSEGSVSQFYLNVLLAKVGLKESDLTPVNMAAPEAGAAFVAGKVDAAVTWEPWLSRGEKTDFGHLLTDSSKTPGLITDIMITTKGFATKHAKAVQEVVDAWNDAVAYARSHPEDAHANMAEGDGGRLKDPKVFAETLKGIKFYGAADNKKFFGTKAKPGPLTNTVEQAIKVWASHGKLQVKVKPTDLIDYRFVEHS